MPEDPQFRISVGLFSQQSRARNRAQTVQALQLEPVMAERLAPETRFWLELRGAAPAAIDLTILRAEGLETGALRIEPCEGGDEVSVHHSLPADTTAGEVTAGTAV